MARPKTVDVQHRISLYLPDDLYRAMEDYRFARRLESRTAAARELLEVALDAQLARTAAKEKRR